MRTVIIFIIFLLRQINVFGSCGFDSRTLTEMLFENKAGTVFSCKILAMTAPKQIISGPDSNGLIRESYSSCGGGIDGTATAQIIKVYFGIVDTNVITLKTGSSLIVGKSYLIYTGGSGRVFACGGSCDQRTHQLTDSPENLSELKVLSQFADIYKNKKSGKYTFVSSTKIVLATGEFKKGVPIKTWKHYFADGTLKTENNLQAKRTKTYYANGLILNDNIEYKDSSVSLVYSNVISGQLNYRWVTIPNEKGSILIMYEYYSNGNLKLLDGQQNIIYPNGSASCEGKIGKYVEGFENGKIKLTGEYNKTKRVGLWKWYNEDGSFNAEVDYKDGTGGQ